MKILLSILFVSIVMICCGELTLSQETELEGTWVKIKPDTPLGGFSIKFTFSGDNFFMRKGVYVDYIDSKDTCRKNRGWVDFAAGKLKAESGEALLYGMWTDSTYINKQVYGCSSLGEFQAFYYYSLRNDTLIFNVNEAVFDESKKYPHVYDMLVFVRSEK
ncbi:MAG: hypothetical protein IAE90_00615 [Ignavibacteria bacterium]|nr:hypothetical protein [Ignavibacteria bacterium]